MKYKCFVLNIQCGRLLNQFPSFDVGTDYRKNGPLTRGCEWNLVKIHVEYLMLRDVRSVQIPGIENLSMKRQHGTRCLLYSKSDMVLMGHPKSHRNDHKHDVHLIVITCRHNYFLFEIHETCRRIWYSSRQNNRNRDKTEKKLVKENDSTENRVPVAAAGVDAETLLLSLDYNVVYLTHILRLHLLALLIWVYRTYVYSHVKCAQFRHFFKMNIISQTQSNFHIHLLLSLQIYQNINSY